MVEFNSDDSNLSKRGHSLNTKSKNPERDDQEPDVMDDQKNDDVFVNQTANENISGKEAPTPGLIGKLSGGVVNTASSAVGTAYGGVRWVAGGVWSTTGTAIGVTYNTVSALSPVNLFRKDSKSKSD